MIRITRIQDVLDFDTGQTRSVMVVCNSAGLQAEVPLTSEQARAFVRLYESDDKSGGSLARVETVPQPAPHSVEPLSPATQPSAQQDGLSRAGVPYQVEGQEYSLTEISYMEPAAGETYDDEPEYAGGVRQL